VPLRRAGRGIPRRERLQRLHRPRVHQEIGARRWRELVSFH
jgi:hypothetical protein